MKYYGNKSLSGVLNIILSIVLVFGVILTGVTYYNTLSGGSIKNIKEILMIILLTIGIVCIFTIVIELKKIIKTLVLENPFTKGNVRSLKKITYSCFIVSACYLVNLLINIGNNIFSIVYIDEKGIHTDGEIFIFVIAACFIGILSKVFDQAVKYKEDNDLTI